MASFAELYPLSSALGLRPVYVSGGHFFSDGQRHEHRHEYDGFDIEDVEKALGERFPALRLYLADKSVFVCGHRVAPQSYTDEDGRKIDVHGEVHCVYASDLEKFLEGNRA